MAAPHIYLNTTISTAAGGIKFSESRSVNIANFLAKAGAATTFSESFKGITHRGKGKTWFAPSKDKMERSLNRYEVTTKPSVILVPEAHRETENGQVLTEKSRWINAMDN